MNGVLRGVTIPSGRDREPKLELTSLSGEQRASQKGHTSGRKGGRVSYSQRGPIRQLEVTWEGEGMTQVLKCARVINGRC